MPCPRPLHFSHINVSDVVKCVLFADDTNIFCSERNLTDLQLTLNRELGKLFVWFSVNKLSLNLYRRLIRSRRATFKGAATRYDSLVRACRLPCTSVNRKVWQFTLKVPLHDPNRPCGACRLPCTWANRIV